MTTLIQLCTLLDLALTQTANPAILREPEANRSVVGLASVYLGEDIAAMLQRPPTVGEVRWVSCPRRNHVLLTALALAKGYDPGPAALDVSWSSADRHHPDVWRGDVHVVAAYVTKIWEMRVGSRYLWFASGPSFFSHAQVNLEWIVAPTVANEPDPVKALGLAVARVLEVPRAHL